MLICDGPNQMLKFKSFKWLPLIIWFELVTFEFGFCVIKVRRYPSGVQIKNSYVCK